MIEDEKPFTLAAAWELYRDAIRWLHALFGPPDDLRLAGSHTRKDHHLLLSWLRSLEALVSCLLFVAAAEIKLEDKPKQPRVHRLGKRMRAAWRIRFRLRGLPQKKTSSVHRTRRAYREPAHFFDTRGLAARFEALRRVAVNPIVYAVRLARRLKRDAELPKRIAQVKLHPRDPFAPNAEAAQIYMREKFPALCDSS